MVQIFFFEDTRCSFDWRFIGNIEWCLGVFLSILRDLHRYIFSKTEFPLMSDPFERIANRCKYKYMQKTQGEEKRNVIYTPRENARLDSSSRQSLDLPRVVHLADIDELPAASPGNLLRVALAHQRLVCGLDCVHLVARATNPGSEVVDTSSAAHLVNQVLDTETEA